MLSLFPFNQLPSLNFSRHFKGFPSVSYLLMSSPLLFLLFLSPQCRDRLLNVFNTLISYSVSQFLYCFTRSVRLVCLASVLFFQYCPSASVPAFSYPYSFLSLRLLVPLPPFPSFGPLACLFITVMRAIFSGWLHILPSILSSVVLSTY